VQNSFAAVPRESDARSLSLNPKPESFACVAAIGTSGKSLPNITCVAGTRLSSAAIAGRLAEFATS